MKDGYCVKCGQSTIIEWASQAAGVATHMFVCSSCGYLETYVVEHTLSGIPTAPGWQKVHPASSNHAVTGVTTRLQHPSAQANLSPQTIDTKSCPVCRSTRLIPNVRVRDTGQSARGDLTVEVERFPRALFLRGATQGQLSASVCGKCGYTMFFADNPAELYAAYREVEKG